MPCRLNLVSVWRGPHKHASAIGPGSYFVNEKTNGWDTTPHSFYIMEGPRTSHRVRTPGQLIAARGATTLHTINYGESRNCTDSPWRGITFD
ncbi:hypothetical protein ElyMa_004179300 [Elysia marginata]|uniref:Uncharacterized protein n=1 Tax=Elysia marginata TaxID=1093978 RepID=A0AAV4GIX0_9GAST|nr:hypothetical protein ElyMa_004179300 [Elysia marginata]